MSLIRSTFERNIESGKKTNIVYLTPDYPFKDITETLAIELFKQNVDLIEIGVPFSDPLADGPTIQFSSFKALNHNVTIASILKSVEKIRVKSGKPIVLMSYLNPIMTYGMENFFNDSQSAGVNGIIIPDMPYDELSIIPADLRKSGIDIILLAAPTSTQTRLEKIASHSRGFIYCVTLTGVTGERNTSILTDKSKTFLKTIRGLSRLPIAAGFGISKPEHIDELKDYCDGFIIGSAFIKALEKGKNIPESITQGLSFINNIYRD